ncbi:MAG: hypothetical protein AAGJ29_00900 [Pseudomonadota bacterium]
MSGRPKLRLSRLRDIGWSVWDPIGLNDFDGKWEGLPFADEYDGYLVQAASMLRANEPDNAAIDYLVKAETEYMGISESAGTRERAKATVEAINADAQIWSYPDN